MVVKSNKSSSFFGRYFSIIILVLVAVGAMVFSGCTASQTDEEFLATYQPQPEIAEIAQKTTMTDKAKAIFYRSDPEFIDTGIFKEYCITNDGIELALACARSTTPGKPRSSPRIFLLQMDNPEFSDTRFPSAAHELMHLVEKASSDDEKKRLAPLIDNELEKYKEDPHVQRITDIIKKSLGDDYQDYLRGEFHSILAVEYADLSPELEEHYAQYFIDRQQLVSLHLDSALMQKIKQLDDWTWQQTQLNSRLSKLRAQLENYQQTGTSTQHQAEFNQYNTLVNQYNAVSAKGKAVQAEVGELYKLINPSYSP